MDTILDSVRGELLAEAVRSPRLLSDLASLEYYVAETYSARSFLELLQNADDAQATQFIIEQIDDLVVCANDGRPFSRDDFYSLCRSGSSNKRRNQSIGYRGIGFKSVAGLASRVHLVSESLEATFSRTLTAQSLDVKDGVPLIRIPHPMALKNGARLFARLSELKRSGLKTFFILEGIHDDRIEEESAAFDAEYLLFLRNVQQVRLSVGRQYCCSCVRESAPDRSTLVTIVKPDGRSDWLLDTSSQSAIAFSLRDDIPVPLDASTAVAHAFLPTLEVTGFGVRINGDFSTDPSRTRILLDESTLFAIDDAAAEIARMFAASIIEPEGDVAVALCLTPTQDVATLPLQKRSFRTELIRRVSERLRSVTNCALIRPSWLNEEDAARVATIVGKRIIGDAQRPTLSVYLRYVGVQVLAFETALDASGALSDAGCAELAAFAIRNSGAGKSWQSAVQAPIWQGSGGREALTSVLRNGALAANFMRMITATGVSNDDIERVVQYVRAAIDPKHIRCSERPEIIEPDAAAPQVLIERLGGQRVAHAPTGSRFLSAWRNAEQAVADYLRSTGYIVEDRSRQNLGYDLYATREQERYYIEVKFLDHCGQPFTMTANEEAVARECGTDYLLCLTLHGDDGLYMQFTPDPISRLKFVRQCRQWVWECSEYEFVPTRRA